MRFDVLTLFDSMMEAVLGDSIIGRARENGIIELNFINIRDFSKNKHKKVDDYPYGGGTGMLMAPQPIYDAYKSITDGLSYKPLTIYMSPQGKTFNQDKAKELLQKEYLVFLCGHYEGVDERVIEEIVDEEISIGDFVVTGGELPALMVCDCVLRMCDGVLSDDVCFEEESHFNGLLEYPQYTRPPEWHGKEVPEVLLSGHHANIEDWRFKMSLERTKEKRPDMFEKFKEEHPELLEPKKRRKPVRVKDRGMPKPQIKEE